MKLHMQKVLPLVLLFALLLTCPAFADIIDPSPARTILPLAAGAAAVLIAAAVLLRIRRK